MFLLPLIDLCVYVTDCFPGLHFSVAEMAVAHFLIIEDLMDMQWPELSAHVVERTAEGQERLAGQMVEKKEEYFLMLVPVSLQFAHRVQQFHCCNKLAVEPLVAEELVVPQEELCIPQQGALWALACFAEHRKVEYHKDCMDIV